jgi:hypothetical protein
MSTQWVLLVVYSAHTFFDTAVDSASNRNECQVSPKGGGGEEKGACVKKAGV